MTDTGHHRLDGWTTERYAAASRFSLVPSKAVGHPWGSSINEEHRALRSFVFEFAVDKRGCETIGIPARCKGIYLTGDAANHKTQILEPMGSIAARPMPEAPDFVGDR